MGDMEIGNSITRESAMKTVYKGDLKIGDDSYNVSMWSEAVKMDKPNIWNGEDHRYYVNFKIGCANLETKNQIIKILRDEIKNKRDD